MGNRKCIFLAKKPQGERLRLVLSLD